MTPDRSPTPTIIDRWTNFVQVLHLFAWSKVQHSRTEENRREESTCLPRGQQVHGTQCYQGQIPKSSAPRIAIVLLSPSPAPGMGSFYFGDFLASIKIMVWFWLGRFWLNLKEDHWYKKNDLNMNKVEWGERIKKEKENSEKEKKPENEKENVMKIKS